MSVEGTQVITKRVKHGADMKMVEQIIRTDIPQSYCVSAEVYKRLTMKELRILDAYGIKVSVDDATRTKDVDQSAAAAKVDVSEVDKMNQNLLIHPEELKETLKAARESAKAMLDESFQNLSTEELLNYIKKMSCIQDTKRAVKDSGYKWDECIAKHEGVWREIIMPILMAKRQKLIDTPSYSKQPGAESRLSTFDMFSKYSTRINPVDTPKTLGELKDLLKSNVVYLLYMKKTTYSLSDFALTRNLSALDRIYGLGTVGAAQVMHDVLEAVGGRGVFAPPTQAQKGVASAPSNTLVTGVAPDGQLSIYNITESKRTISPKGVLRAWITAPEDVMPGLDLFGDFTTVLDDDTFAKSAPQDGIWYGVTTADEFKQLFEDIRRIVLAQPNYGANWSAVYEGSVKQTLDYLKGRMTADGTRYAKPFPTILKALLEGQGTNAKTYFAF